MNFERPLADRSVPEIPPPDDRIRVIIDTDAKNEIDDQWALTLALLADERFKIEGLVGSAFDNHRGGRNSITDSVEEIERVVEKVGRPVTCPILPGAPPMQFSDKPSVSEGVEFIVEKALESDPDDPIWVIGLGCATDMASALLLDERIIDHVVAFWHLRTDWPDRCTNFNVFTDVRAARLLFHAPVPFVLFDTGEQLTCPMEESQEQVAPYGDIGSYLHEYRHRDSYFADPEKGFFDLGDIAGLVDPSLATWETVEFPRVDYNLRYQFGDNHGQIVRCADLDRDGVFTLFYDRLQSAYS